MQERNIPKIITISGFPGSGKSTTAKALAKELGYEYFSVGTLLRKMAKDKGISLVEMSRLAEQDSKIDRQNDKEMVDWVVDHPNTVVDSRIAAWMLREEGIKAYNVLLEAPLELRSNRIADRDGLSPDKSYEITKKREKSEIERYKSIYDIDMLDKSVYDLVIQTEGKDPEEVLSTLLGELIK